MRRLVLLIVLGLAPLIGCGESRQEVRLSSTVPVEPPQQELDGIAAKFLNGLFGGSR